MTPQNNAWFCIHTLSWGLFYRSFLHNTATFSSYLSIHSSISPSYFIHQIFHLLHSLNLGTFLPQLCLFSITLFFFSSRSCNDGSVWFITTYAMAATGGWILPATRIIRVYAWMPNAAFAHAGTSCLIKLVTVDDILLPPFLLHFFFIFHNSQRIKLCLKKWAYGIFQRVKERRQSYEAYFKFVRNRGRG